MPYKVPAPVNYSMKSKACPITVYIVTQTDRQLGWLVGQSDDGWTDRRMDGQTDGEIDRQKYRQMDGWNWMVMRYTTNI